MTEQDSSATESKLANNAFIHGRSYKADMDHSLSVMKEQLRYKNDDLFDGIRLDTAANRRSVISKGQYYAYQSEFGRKVKIRLQTKVKLRGTGGHEKVIGEATIQIPFNKLGLVIDVDFGIIYCNIPTLLSNNYMINNCLDLSLQGQFLHIGQLQQHLTLEKYFLVYRWSATDTPYALYTEKILRKIHRNFGHPSVQSTLNLLKRASETKLTKNMRRELEKMRRSQKIVVHVRQIQVPLEGSD